jgi:hypothetical protein
MKWDWNSRLAILADRSEPTLDGDHWYPVVAWDLDSDGDLEGIWLAHGEIQAPGEEICFKPVRLICDQWQWDELLARHSFGGTPDEKIG